MTERIKKHYINNNDFLNALILYKKQCSEAKETGKEAPPIPDYIGQCWIKIAEGLSHKPNFLNYTYREEMIGDGIENCLMYFHNFNPEKSQNPFAYFTQIIYYAFLRRIEKEKKQTYVKYKSTQQMGIFGELESSDSENTGKQVELYENISEFIHTWEESKRKKKDSVKPSEAEGIEIYME
jgi:hypothetical protein